MFKNFFNSRKLSSDLMKANQVDVVLRLMFEIAMSDGYLDKAELEILKKRAAEVSSEKASVIIKKVIQETESSSSLYPTVKEINDQFSHDQKKEILRALWGLVASDGVINHYEENLYFKIADLIKIKRSQANQIKQSFG
jgi:uncharacterized tellurite resistance protein B-like protein